jgi:hypothetical protein
MGGESDGSHAVGAPIEDVAEDRLPVLPVDAVGAASAVSD